MGRRRRAIERKPEQRQKERVMLAAQLVVGQDDALINWLMSIPKGNRDRAIKQAIGEWLGTTPTEEDTQPVQPVNFTDERAAQRIAELEALVRSLMEQQRLLIEQQNQWNSYIDGRLNALAIGADSGTVEVIESTPRITDEKREKRRTNLKKASW